MSDNSGSLSNIEGNTRTKVDMNSSIHRNYDDINQEIIDLNNGMREKYIYQRTEIITEELIKYVSSLDKKRLEESRKINKKGKKKSPRTDLKAKETKETKMEDADEEFIDALRDMVTVAETFYKLLHESRSLDMIIKKRLEDTTTVIKNTLSDAIRKKNYIFKETEDIMNFIKQYYDIIRDLKKKIIDLNMGKGPGLCGGPNPKKDIKMLTIRLEQKMFAFPIIFKLQPRMTQHITTYTNEETNDSVVFEPKRLMLEQQYIREMVQELLEEEFPELEPTKEVIVKDNIIKVENEKIVTKIAYEQKEPEKEKTPKLLKAQKYYWGFGKPKNFQKALKNFLKAEKLGEAEASNCLGRMYLEGKGVPKDHNRAYEHFKKSADQNNSEGSYNVGYMIENEMIKDTPGTSKIDRAVMFYRLAAKQNHPEALTDLAFLYENGVLGKSDYQKAFDHYTKAVELGNPRAMNNLASLHLKFPGNTERFYNPYKAFKLYEKSAGFGYSKARTNMGICHLRGIGTEKDFIAAKKIFKETASQNDPDAIFYLSYFKLKEVALEPDDSVYEEVADKLRYVVSVEKNHAEALYYLGYLHENGLGVDQDYRTATSYYSKAVEVSEETNAKAMYKLGNMLYSNKRDQERAIELYKKAAELGDKDAIYVLGVLYEEGIVVEQDIEAAKKLYETSAVLGNTDAKKHLAKFNPSDDTGNKGFNRTMPEDMLKQRSRYTHVKENQPSNFYQTNQYSLFNTINEKQFMRPMNQTQDSFYTNSNRTPTKTPRERDLNTQISFLQKYINN